MWVLAFSPSDCAFILSNVNISQQTGSRRGICWGYNLTSLVLRALYSLFGRVQLYSKNKMLEITTTLAGTGKRAGLLWQMARQSVGQPIDWAASGCDLCLPFLSHLKGEVSGSDRVMYKSSTWLVTPRWALYQPSSLSSCKKLHRKRWYLMWSDGKEYTVLYCRAKTAWI